MAKRRNGEQEKKKAKNSKKANFLLLLRTSSHCYFFLIQGSDWPQFYGHFENQHETTSILTKSKHQGEDHSSAKSKWNESTSQGRRLGCNYNRCSRNNFCMDVNLNLNFKLISMSISFFYSSSTNTYSSWYITNVNVEVE